MEVVAVSGALGAEVSDIRLAEVTDDEFADIRDAFHKHCMLAFPGQFLTIDEHVAFAGKWGEWSISPFVTYLETHPCVLALTNRGKEHTVTEAWHTDSAFLPQPPALNVLSAHKVPIGGDTMWSNQYRAYERLSSGMKSLLEGVRAEYIGTVLAALGGSDDVPTTYHPLVRTHPETGRKALYMTKPGATISRLEGMTPAESRPLLDYLYDFSTQPDNVHRHHWSDGDVVMWDNRCTMHFAVHDYGDAVRDIHRISIKGDAPV